MKPFIYSLVLTFFTVVPPLVAQSTADYTPARGSITYSSIISSGSSFSWRNGTDSTSNRSTLTNIGFDFWYLGQRYTQFCANVNGNIDLNVNSTATGAPLGGYDADNQKFFYEPLTIAALYDSLAVPSGGSLSGNIKYEVTGTFPDRILTVEWYNMTRAANSSPSLNFQIKLYEGTGAIEFDYGTMTAGTATYSYLVGIHDTSATPPPSTAEALVQQSPNSTTFSNTETDNLSTIPSSNSNIRLTPPTASSPTSLAFADVRWNKLTLNWTNNATNDLHYAIYRSTDGGSTYSYYDTLAPNSTSFTAYPLTINTSYKWQVCAITDGGLSFSVGGTQGTNDGLLSGTYSVGPTGTFTDLTAALDSIRSEGIVGPVVFELQSNYTSSGETFPVALLDSNWASATNTITIRPAAGATGLSITSSNSTGTIEFNKANYFTIDGRPGGTGSSVGLVISNASTSGYAVEFTSMSLHNTLEYCDLQGANTNQNSGGVVEFVGAATDQYGNSNTKGNQDNVLTHCNIHDGSSTPANGINLSGLSGLPDSNTTISYNNIYNFFTASNNFSNGIYVPGFVENLNVIGNSFYQTAPRTASASQTMTGVDLNGSGISPVTIDSNYIGGSAAEAGGSALTLGPTSQSVDFFGIEVNSSPTIGHIENNTIKNISLSTGSTDGPTFAGVMIYSADSSYVIGDTVGSDTGTSSITMTSSNNNGLQGIATWSGSNTIDYNIVGSITTSVTSGSVHSYLYGIAVSTTGELATISGNTVGSVVTPNSIDQSSSSTASFEPVAGIYYGPNGTATITKNTIAHITNSFAGSSEYAQLFGITFGGYAGTSATPAIVDSNTVEDLTAPNQDPYSGINASIIGISCPVGYNFTMLGNSVDSLVNTASSASVNVIGIFTSTSASGTNTVGENRVANLILSSSSTSAAITGLWAAAGKVQYQNNMISVGDGLTTPYQIFGIRDTSTSGTNNYYFNSVLVSGTGVGTTATNTYAFYRQSTPASTTEDNLFINNRSNASTGGSHYAAYVANTSGLTADFNDYYAGGTGGATGYSGGSNSVSEPVTFVSNDSLRLAGSSVSDIKLHGTPIAGIGTDYFGITRSATSPTMGANEQSGDVSLAVQATDFKATAGAGSVTLSWSTQSEVDNAGFNILRSDPAISDVESRIADWKLIASYTTDDSLRGRC